jgi:3-oxoacyl-(acyl-carrier-protein) synthase
MDVPIAITGLGLITAQGVGVPAMWDGVVAARDVLRPWAGAPQSPDGISPHPLAALRVAACPPPPRPADLPPRLWRRLSRTQQLAAVAADEAVAAAGLPRDLSRVRAGLFLATTVCGMDQNEQFYAQYHASAATPPVADAALMRRLQAYEVAALVARRHRIAADDPGLRQVCLTTCVGSAMALGNAADAIAAGECDVALAGGAEALCRVVLSGFHALKVVSPDGCRPFDLNRPGITVGEGAAVLVLESVAHARGRGARPLAHLRGFGVTCDAHHLTAPDPQARQAARAVRDALARAGLVPADVGYVNAHGTGTRDNDAMEARALADVFGDAVPAVSSTKRCTGHTFGAAGAIEAALCVQALATGTLPPNAGTVTQDPALPLPLVRSARPAPALRHALSTNFAFGGNNTALVFSTP